MCLRDDHTNDESNHQILLGGIAHSDQQSDGCQSIVSDALMSVAAVTVLISEELIVGKPLRHTSDDVARTFQRQRPVRRSIRRRNDAALIEVAQK